MSPNDLPAILARYPAAVRPCTPPEALGNAGGGSGARLWRFPSGHGLLLARAWPIDGPGFDRLVQIHRWLGLAAELGFVPVPISALDGRTLQEAGGRFWEVTPWQPGSPASELPCSTARLRAGYRGLAAFHQRVAADACRGPSPGLRARFAELEQWRSEGFARLRRVLAIAPADRLCDLALRWVELAVPLSMPVLELLHRAARREVGLQPCLRDARPEHLLFDGEHLTGLIDFGAMGIDSVAADLARLLPAWPGSDPLARSVALDAYAALRPLEPDELPLVQAFEHSSALLGAGHWARWHFLEGRPFDDPQAVERGLEHGLDRLIQLAAALG